MAARNSLNKPWLIFKHSQMWTRGSSEEDYFCWGIKILSDSSFDEDMPVPMDSRLITVGEEDEDKPSSVKGKSSQSQRQSACWRQTMLLKTQADVRKVFLVDLASQAWAAWSSKLVFLRCAVHRRGGMEQKCALSYDPDLLEGPVIRVITTTLPWEGEGGNCSKKILYCSANSFSMASVCELSWI